MLRVIGFFALVVALLTALTGCPTTAKPGGTTPNIKGTGPGFTNESPKQTAVPHGT
jgi:hypothetical protein